MPAKGQDIPMHTSLVIARLLGPLFSTIGIGMLTNNDSYRQIGAQFLASYAIIYLSGIVVLLMGLIILNVHNVWGRNWRSVITTVGWVFTMAGMWRIIAPQFVPFVGGAILANRGFFTGAGIVLLALGGFLTFKGYVSAAAIEMETRP
jgi:uncharacterized membrane protein